VFDLAVDLHRSSLAHKLAAHYAAAAQRDAAAAGPLLRHMLSSACFAGCGLKQLGVLRAGFEAAWAGGQGPEVLLVHVLLEVYEALRPQVIRDATSRSSICSTPFSHGGRGPI
jgi:hypothetical protein